MKFNYRIVVFAAAIFFGLFFSAPSLLQTQDGKKIALGLDLQGGLHMLLGVKTEEAVKSRIKSIAASIKYFTEKKDILVDGLSFDENGISFTLLDKDDVKTLKSFLHEIQGAVVVVVGENISLSLTNEEIARTKEQAISQAIETIRNRLDQFGLAEPIVARQGEEKILVQLAGIKTAEDEQRSRELISRAAKLELMAVDEDRAARVGNMSASDAAAYGDVILEDVANPSIKHLVREIPVLDGGMLTDASVGFDQNNRPLITFKLNAEGAQIFGDFTAKSV
ncbi:MAG: protein translocase subunit SecD, partial [Sulfurimonas sp.]|nr:protein translocase subunit SecD [Sulfurimonas sp.]